MPKLRQLSGRELISIFNQFGFIVEARRGSHVKLRRLREGARQTLTIPAHSRIDTGTLRAILRQAVAYIPEADLYPHFHTD
jgi:predicted RNA binding protein YcfA (HicA-like mRNA interferase family)